MGDVRISDEAAVLYIDIRTRSQHFRESGQTADGNLLGVADYRAPGDEECCARLTLHVVLQS